MSRLALAAVAGAGWVATVGAATAPHPARAAPAVAVEHRAAVIVDTGTEVRTVCVRFAEESLTGIEALTRAAVDPVLRAFPGKGAAVCSLCGTGCPGDESCLTCDPGGRFWSYSRAPAGTGALRTSGAGASSTTVRDGDVEGWQWGRGGTPPFVTVEVACGEVAATSTSTSAPPGAPDTTAPAAPTTTAAAAPGTAPAPRGPRGPATTPAPAAPATTAAPPPLAPSAGAPTTVDAAAASPTTTVPPGALGDLAASRRGDRGDGAGWAGLVGFAAVLAGLVGWAAVARRHRRRAGRS